MQFPRPASVRLCVWQWVSVTLVYLVATPMVAGEYDVAVVDVDGNREYRLLHQEFHFASFIVTDVGGANGLVLRPHPDLDAPDGWGASLFAAPFIAGADSGGVFTVSARSVRRGVVLRAAGFIQSATGVSGLWVWGLRLGYDPATELVSSRNGFLPIWLDDALNSLGSDLNLYRLSTNYLHQVPLQSGGIGDTGDIMAVNYQYGADPDPRDFTWLPPLLPAHFPFDLPSHLVVDAVGTINDVDTLALGEDFQINVAPKPTLKVTLKSQTPDSQMIAGMVWDVYQGQNFAADNVGVTPIVPHTVSSAQFLVFEVAIESTPPPQ